MYLEQYSTIQLSTHFSLISGTSFQFPSKRSEVLEYTNNNFLKGGLIRSDITSIRVLEHMNETERKEKEEIDEKLLKIEAEKRHVEVLVNAVKEWLGLLKGIHRLSKGVPLMRSVTKVSSNLQGLQA